MSCHLHTIIKVSKTRKLHLFSLTHTNIHALNCYRLTVPNFIVQLDTIVNTRRSFYCSMVNTLNLIYIRSLLKYARHDLFKF